MKDIYEEARDYYINKYKFAYNDINMLILVIPKENAMEDINKYKSKINKYIINNIKLSNKGNEKDLLNKFINNNFDNKYFGNITKFISFIEETNINLKPDDLIALFDNNILYRTVDNLYNNNIELNNNIYSLIINTYCMINKIDNNDIEEFCSENYEAEDSYKQYIKDIKRIPLLSYEEELDLAYKAKKGDEQARKKLIESNLRLVVNIALKYNNSSIDLMDLIQEGNMGLIDSINKFDPSLGYKFSTYTYNWIDMYILRYINFKSNLIKVPYNKVIDSRRLFREKTKYYNKYGKEPTIKELSKLTGLTEDEIININNISFSLTSLNQPVSEEDDAEVQDFIEDPNSDFSFDIQNVSRSEILDLFDVAGLDEDEINILFMRYGFYNNKLYTLQEISEKYNCSREGIRLKLKGILIKLRKCEFTKRYAEYIDYPEQGLKNIELYQEIGKERITTPYLLKKIYNIHEVYDAQSIYDIFDKYDQKDIDSAISTLKKYDQIVIRELFATVNAKSDERKFLYFYRRLIPRLHNYLTDNCEKSFTRKRHHE